MARWLQRFAPGVLAAVLAGCATLTAGPGVTLDSIEIDGRSYRAHWAWPTPKADALVILAHGFARGCANLHGTMRHWADAGLAVLCIDAVMARGNPPLADALARRLDTLRGPDGRALPVRVVAAGHSAGGVFAVTLAATLGETAAERLAGTLLVDPVATDTFDADLGRAAASRPVLALLAPPHGCNAQGNALPALRRVEREAQGRLVVQLVEGATHLDLEGEDSGALAEAACGRPQPARTAALREATARWARGLR